MKSEYLYNVEEIKASYCRHVANFRSALRFFNSQFIIDKILFPDISGSIRLILMTVEAKKEGVPQLLQREEQEKKIL
jgi:hypothetical protein